ncbi:hypothetical protein PFISCL1PPCAC_22392 [Pristionchus fissidentatus]|uniref:Uncharacterized protein n=1 Tax=Pristionchus fissidentatus TaxID=1538716 RepID=A0AAV5WKN9_9BILA|nr:hypothetical protein PFISCL1PPCAC_22392 [Pristionchus fissidentatus]
MRLCSKSLEEEVARTDICSPKISGIIIFDDRFGLTRMHIRLYAKDWRLLLQLRAEDFDSFKEKLHVQSRLFRKAKLNDLHLGFYCIDAPEELITEAAKPFSATEVQFDMNHCVPRCLPELVQKFDASEMRLVATQCTADNRLIKELDFNRFASANISADCEGESALNRMGSSHFC